MNKLLYLLLISPLFFISSCVEEDQGPVPGCIDSQACNYNPDANMADGSCIYSEVGYDCDGNINFEVGDLAEGGIVFYVDSTGHNGLVAAMEDLEGLYEWGCQGTDINGYNSSISPELYTIGSGLQNTIEIVVGCSDTSIAASEALAYESGGYGGWYLPSKDELQEMYYTIGNGGSEGNIGGFETSDDSGYWSSSEYNGYANTSEYGAGAYVYYFESGGSNDQMKDSSLRVRVIRSF